MYIIIAILLSLVLNVILLAYTSTKDQETVKWLGKAFDYATALFFLCIVVYVFIEIR